MTPNVIHDYNTVHDTNPQRLASCHADPRVKANGRDSGLELTGTIHLSLSERMQLALPQENKSFSQSINVKS